jgi:hypothetical protein
VTAGAAEMARGETVTHAVRCADLTYRFGAHTAVDRVDLDIEPGEMFGLLGTPTTLWLDTVVLVGATLASITCASLLLPRLANR